MELANGLKVAVLFINRQVASERLLWFGDGRQIKLVGGVSSSSMVKTAVFSPKIPFSTLNNVKVNVSSGSGMASGSSVRLIFSLRLPGVKVSVPLLSRKSCPTVAVPPVTLYCTVVVRGDGVLMSMINVVCVVTSGKETAVASTLTVGAISVLTDTSPNHTSAPADEVSSPEIAD